MPPSTPPPSQDTDANERESSLYIRRRLGSITYSLAGSFQSDSDETASNLPGPGRPLGQLLFAAGRRLEVVVDRTAPLAGLGFKGIAARFGLGYEGIARRLVTQLRAPHASCRTWPEFAKSSLVELTIELGGGFCFACDKTYMSALSDKNIREVEYLLLRLVRSLESSRLKNRMTGSTLLSVLALSDDNLLAVLRQSQDDTWLPAWRAVHDLQEVLTLIVPMKSSLVEPYSDDRVLDIWRAITSCVSLLPTRLRYSPLMSPLLRLRLANSVKAGQDLIRLLYKPSTQPHLDALYVHMLSDCSGEKGKHLGKLLATVAVLERPVTLALLNTLLELPSHDVAADVGILVDARLLITDSLLLDPIADTTIIRVIHDSLREFITDPLRCGLKRYLVDAADYHGQLSDRCLRLLCKYLRQDICNIRNPGQANAEITDLSARIGRSIPEAVRYACLSWPVHLVSGGPASGILPVAWLDFCHNHLLHWIEVLSLLGELSYAGEHLPRVIAWFQRNFTDEPSMQTVLIRLRDTRHAVHAYASPITSHALHVYHSVLVTIPDCELLNYARSSGIVVPRLVSQRASDWSDELYMMEAHTSEVNSVACSLDGARIVSGSGDNTLRVWNARTGKQLAVLESHSDSVWSVTFSPDGAQIVSGSGDNTVLMWDVLKGKELFTLEGHSGSVWSVAFSPDGMHIVSGSDDKTVRLWDARTGMQLHLLKGHTDWVGSVAFSLDGAHIVSGSGDHTIRVWDAQTGRQLALCEGHRSSVWSVAASPGDVHIVSGSEDTTVRVWNALAGKQLAVLEGHNDLVRSVTFSPDATLIVSGSHDKTVRVWNAQNNTQLAVFKGHSGWVRSLAISRDGAYIFSGSDDKTIRVWNVWASQKLDFLDGHSACVRSVAFSPDGAYIASGSDDETVRMWDAQSGKQIAVFEGHSSWVRCVVFSPDGMHVISGSDDKSVRMWDTHSGQQLAVFEGHRGWVSSVAYSPDGKHMASGSQDKTVRLWDLQRGKQLAVLEGHGGRVKSVAFSADAKYILSVDHHGRELTWNVKKVRGVLCLESSTSPITGPPNKDKEALVWNEETGWISWQNSDDGREECLCWLPLERRGESFAWHEDRAVIGARQGGVTILNFSDVISMLRRVD